MRVAPIALLAACVTSTLAASPAGAAEFPPHQIYVASSNDDRVLGFDLAGNQVFEFAPGSDVLHQPMGIGFGPDGYLYVTSGLTDEVLKVDAAGTVVDTLSHAQLQGPLGIALGPGGTLYVTGNTSSNVIVLQNDGTFLANIQNGPTFTSPYGLTFGTDGQFYLGHQLTIGSGLVQFAPSVAVIGEIGTGIAFGLFFPILGPSGEIWTSLAGNAGVVRLDADGQNAGMWDGDVVGSAAGIAFGPDGALYVADMNANRIRKVKDGVLLDEFGMDANLDTPVGLCISPQRFKVKVKGIIAGSTSAAKLKSTAILSVAPGTPTAMLHFVDDALAGRFPSNMFVAHGFEGLSDEADKKRVLQGLEVWGRSRAEGTGSIALVLKGKVDDHGAFVVKKVSGTLDRASQGEVFSATITMKKRLN